MGSQRHQPYDGYQADFNAAQWLTTDDPQHSMAPLLAVICKEIDALEGPTRLK